MSARASVRAKERDRRRRRKLEAALAEKGVAPEVIADVLAEIQQRQAERRDRERLPAELPSAVRRQFPEARVISLTDEERARLQAQQDRFWANQPDDKGYRPKRIDSLTQGDARASGATALAVRRGKTLTKWEHEQMEARA
jgi:SOS response regulatory protein OraA/RecX